MSAVESYDILVIGSGEAGKYLAWTLAKAGNRTAVVERKYIGGSCPNIACLPSKNLIHSAKVASLASRSSEFGIDAGPAATNMKAVQFRKRKMVEDLIAVHSGRYEESGAELIMGEAQFVSPKTVTISLNDGGTRVIAGERVFLNVGTGAADTDAEAQFLATTQFQSFLRLTRGVPGKMQPPVENIDDLWTPQEKAAVDSRLGGSIIGGPAMVKERLEEVLAETNADELMFNAMIFDHAARLRAYEIVASAWKESVSTQRA